MSVCILLTAVEASGDALGAELMRALKARLGPEVRFVGVGGDAMAAEGLVSAFPIGELSIVGLVEGLFAFARARRRARELAELARRERPDIAVLIDSWGFSYLAARALRRRLPGLPLVKYVAPQVWATRPGRAKALARSFDRLLSIIAFEPQIFEAAGAKVVFVGHPALTGTPAPADPEGFRAEIGARPEDQILLVLPGSRHSEIDRLMPPFTDAIRRLKAERPHLHVVVLAASTVTDRVIAEVAGWPFRAHVVTGDADKADAMAAATVALACSGTATVELAAAGAPMVIAYRLGPLTYQIARRIIRIPYAALFNLAAGAAVAPELLQDACTGPNLAREIALRLDDPVVRVRQVEAQNGALEQLGRGGAPTAERAADEVVGMLDARESRT